MTPHSGWRERAVLVTGGAGFIGSHLVEQLVAANACVVVVDDLSTGAMDNLAAVEGAIDFIRTDVRSAVWEDILGERRLDAIYHLAANAYVPPSVERPCWDCELNFQSTLRLLEALRCAKWRGRLVYASSAAVYGDPRQLPINEDDATVPISPYGVGKLAAERYVSVFSSLYGLRTASLRFFSIYGPRQHKQVVYDFVRKLQEDESELYIHGDGTQVREFCYVADAVRAAMLVGEQGALQGEVYNVSSGHACSIRGLAEMVCVIMDVDPEFVFSGAVRPGDAQTWTVNIDRLMGMGYQPQVSLEDGLRSTVDWCRSVEWRT